jgi:tRNA C32,U32 (ribose-2'-O)-methylase TrmJ
MNLGQAVALAAYELSRSRLESSVTEPDERLLEGRQLDGLARTAMAAMAAAGVNAHLPEAVRLQKLRRGLMRWSMTRADASWLRGLLERLIERSSATRA